MGLDLLFEMRLEPSPDGGTLAVVHPAYEQPHAVVDLQTWEVSKPEASDTQPPPASTAAPAEAASDDGAPIVLIAGAAALGLALLVVLLRVVNRLRRAPEPTDVELGDLLLDDAPHRLPEVEPEAHEPERPRVLVP
jgi:hypothetical protein